MTRAELLAMVSKMAETSDALSRTLLSIARVETDPRRHAVWMRLHNALRDAALGLRHAIADAPTMVATS
jgi:hypothetical protein